MEPEEHETDKTTTNASALWKHRRCKELRCGYCKPHKNENATRKAKPDKHKNKDRTTIRRFIDE